VRSNVSFSLRLPLFCLLITTCLSGCVQNYNTETTHQQQNRQLVPLLETEELSALSLEKDEKYIKAIEYWKSAEKIIQHKIESLSAQLHKISSDHAAQGIVLFEKKDSQKAFKQFMEALRYDPSNDTALDYLKNHYKPGKTIEYTVQEGDTFRTIAATIYKDPSYSFTLALFSTVTEETSLIEGKTIYLADLDSFTCKISHDYTKNILLARKYFKAENFEELLPFAENLQTKNPNDDEISYILNKTLLSLAKIKQENGEYLAAIELLTKVSPHFRNVKKQIGELEARLISNTQLFEKGQNLLQEKKYVEALEAFQHVDSNYAGIRQAVSKVQKKLGELTDYHYRKGVAMFVDEKLLEAISEWEIALEYSPEHQQSLYSIAKAQTVLEKMKTIK
jgi:tetratricopeptide (TPR) repeat protein